MNENVHNQEIRLIPVGGGFLPEEETAVLSEESARREIDLARKEFKRKVLGKTEGATERRTRDEQPFVNKVRFILRREHEACWEHLLPDLLADESTLFSRGYQIYATDHRVYLEIRRQQGNTAESWLRRCLDKSLSDVPYKQKERYEKLLRRVVEKAKQENKPLLKVEREMLDATSKEQTVNWLKGWIPDFEPREDEVLFLDHVLRAFFGSVRNLRLEKEAAGHYSAQYQVRDKRAFLAYRKRKECLEKALKQYREWRVQGELVNVSRLPNPIVDLMGTSGKKMQPHLPEEKIAEATREYLTYTRGGAEHFDIELAKEVVRQTAAAVGGKVACFPMLYLMVCVAGSSQLFATTRRVEQKMVLTAFKAPYYQKPAMWQQRILRIKFLYKLHELCSLDRKQRAASWESFLGIHGSEICSSEESALWRKVIWGGKQMLDDPVEDIPFIRLSLLCTDCLQSCLLLRPEQLFGYRSVSPLRRSGFAQFLREYPDALPAIVEKVSRQPKRWGDVQEQYLKLWSAIPCNLEEICELLRQGCGMIRWGLIPNASQEELSRFCQSLHKDNKADEKQIASDVEELKMLLTEMALRTVLTDRARQVLADKIEEAWSKDNDFKFRVSFSKKSKTEEL